ncbi:hypothetical protein ACFS5J_06760 [Flavobacterium chuncheonense]|uniref:Uncharacterized protein n=1 Tax=Flavobacterium chuncheonense TaxID=2026653 RepID=A0ABW5YL31_9FLAO
MNKKELAETLKYASPRVIYVVTWNNLLKKLFCPFQVKVIHDIGALRIGDIVFVEAVKVNLELKTVYIIQGKAYYYYHFEIIV